MKSIKSVMLTIVCALGILAAGYLGLQISGKQVLKSASEPEKVTMDGNISNLFYSRIEDDITLYPWNYYPAEEEAEGTELPERLDLLEEYVAYMENEVYYPLIALAADVELFEVRWWYEAQGSGIFKSMKQGRNGEEYVELFFYDERLRLGGREYEVKLACDFVQIHSFSCSPVREEGVKDSAEWDANRETFLTWMEENTDWILLAFDMMYTTYLELNYGYPEVKYGGYNYVLMYQTFQELTQNLDAGISLPDENGEAVKEKLEKAYEALGLDVVAEASYPFQLEEYPLQMIELRDSILLMVEMEPAMALYYDVLEQKITGFHYF